jgi:ribosomal protein L32E
LWTPHYTSAFPNADFSVSIYQARAKAKNHLEKIRKLRNRIAHHEPIFVRNIQEEYDRILEVIEWRSPISKDWVHKMQKVTDLNQEKPIP